MSLEAAGLAEYIDVACAATVIGSAKPEASAYERVLKDLSVKATSTILFDDEKPCIAGALAVGIHAFLVRRDLSEHDIEKGVVRDLTAIPEILNGYSVAREVSQESSDR